MKEKRIELYRVNNAIWWAPVEQPRKIARHSPASGSSEHNKPMSMTKKDKKRICRMLRFCSRVPEGEAKVFMTLNFDYDVKAWTSDECLEQIALFKRYLIRSCPHGWFVYVLESSMKSGVHAHFWGRFGKPRVWKRVRKKWLGLTHSRNRAMFHIRVAQEHDVAYMVKPTKRKGRIKLLQDLGRRSSWGTVNRGNIPQLEPKRYVFSAESWVHFQLGAVYHLKMNKAVSPNLSSKFCNQSGAAYLGMPPGFFKKLIKYVKKCRRSSS